MALKFLNKKGWHTGSLRNIENVWKAEQKHEAEQRKLEELKKQIHEEREKAEFRDLQVQAGLIPKQERLDFLYESGLAVGKGSSSSFQALDSLPKTEPEPPGPSSSSASAAKQQAVVPGALFDDKEKPQSANDSWRKLHSDPLLMIRQREQEALARVKNNPVQMAMIRKSVEATKDNGKGEKKKKSKHHKKKSSKRRKHSSSENDSSDSEDAPSAVEKQRERHHKGGSHSDKPSRKEATHNSDKEEPSERDDRRKKYYENDYKHRRTGEATNARYERSERNSNEESNERDYERKKYYESEDRHRRDSDRSESQHRSQPKEYSSERQVESRHDKRPHYSSSDNRPHYSSSDKPPRNDSSNRHRKPLVKMSEEERAARLKEMQLDAERHEEQRWKRLKKAADSDAQEAILDKASMGRHFLDAAQKSVFGADKGGSATIEESVRRRTHYSQGRSSSESNAFRR